MGNTPPRTIAPANTLMPSAPFAICCRARAAAAVASAASSGFSIAAISAGTYTGIPFCGKIAPAVV